MRNVPSLGARATVAMAEFNNHLSPPVITAIHAAPLSSPTTVKCDAQKCPWWPYTNSADFKANTALILVILFCALICAVALNSVIRFIIRVYCCRRQDAEDPKVELGEAAADKEAEIPTLIYSAGMELKGGEPECIICLSEFAIGERVRVLKMCNHGFHVQCIQKWLISHSSCPTCRTNCASSAP